MQHLDKQRRCLVCGDNQVLMSQKWGAEGQIERIFVRMPVMTACLFRENLLLQVIIFRWL